MISGIRNRWLRHAAGRGVKVPGGSMEYDAATIGICHTLPRLVYLKMRRWNMMNAEGVSFASWGSSTREKLQEPGARFSSPVNCIVQQLL
jgi:hypothetical protein